MFKLWDIMRALFLEGMLNRTENGEKLGVFSKRGWGSNLMLAGVTGLIIGAVWFAQRVHFELDSLTTTSEVVEVNRGKTNDGKTVYELTLSWIDHRGTTHVTVPRVRSSSYNVLVGTELDIDYDPNNPRDVRVKTKEGPWYFPRMILFGSVTSFLLGWFIRRRAQS